MLEPLGHAAGAVHQVEAAGWAAAAAGHVHALAAVEQHDLDWREVPHLLRPAIAFASIGARLGVDGGGERASGLELLAHLLLDLGCEVKVCALALGVGGGSSRVTEAGHAHLQADGDPGCAKLRLDTAALELLVGEASEVLHARGGERDEAFAESARRVAAGEGGAAIKAEVLDEAARKLGELGGGGGEAAEPRVGPGEVGKHVLGGVEVARLHRLEVEHAGVRADADVRHDADHQHRHVGHDLRVCPRI